MVTEMPAEPQGGPGRRHARVLTEGDTLWSIALGDGSHVWELETLNELDCREVSRLGQESLIPWKRMLRAYCRTWEDDDEPA